MIRIEDLSEQRQKDFADTIKYNEPWMSDKFALQHAIGALQQDELEKWEQYGFGSLKKFKWAYNNGVNYYNTHKLEVEAYLRDRTMKQREDNGWFQEEKPEYVGEIQVEEEPVKLTAAEKKELDKVQKLVKKMLYGAGNEGWTKEWFEKIKKAYENNTLTITGCEGDCNLILARENLKEEDLTDQERLLLFMYCHPKHIVYVKPDAMATVLSPKWHELTNWKHIGEVYRNYRGIYNEWVKKGIIPVDKMIEEVF